MHKISKDTDKSYKETKIGYVAGSDGGRGWELRAGPSEKVAFKRDKESIMGTWEVGKGTPGTGDGKGSGLRWEQA